MAIERQLVRNLTVSVSYALTRGNRFPVTIDTNLPQPRFQRAYQLADGTNFTVPFVAGITRNAAGQTVNINTSRPNPALGAILSNTSIGKTWYQAMFVEIRKRFSVGYQWNISYTLAKAENLAGDGNGGGSGSEGAFSGTRLYNQFDMEGNRQTSPTDQRHRLVSNGIWNLGEKLNSGVAAKLIKGFRLSGIHTVESGRPVAALVSLPNIPFATPDGAQWNGFGGLLGQGGGPAYAPNEPRNGRYGEWNYRFDLRLARDFTLTERLRIEVIGEAFNLFNTTNFNGYTTTAYQAVATTVTTPLATPVRLNTDTNYFRANSNSSQPDGTNARRFQLAMRLRF
jgi:hypothetical protein